MNEDYYWKNSKSLKGLKGLKSLKGVVIRWSRFFAAGEGRATALTRVPRSTTMPGMNRSTHLFAA